ncbi:MAG TPA: SRPBCC family protein [Pseudonocardiaceae bacterium]|nr:SRPBCC family protein [Pseudonocardiaceae bacterium]
MNQIPFDPGPLAEVHGSDQAPWTLVFVRDLHHPPAKVWSALTDPAQLTQWAPYTADRNLGGVGEATLSTVDSDQPVDVPAMISHAEEPILLEYTWGEEALRWELAPIDVGTRLTLRHTVTGQDWMPKVAAGWHLCLVVADTVLAGNPMPPIRGMDAMNYGWADLNEAYAKQLSIPVTPFPEDFTG